MQSVALLNPITAHENTLLLQAVVDSQSIEDREISSALTWIKLMWVQNENCGSSEIIAFFFNFTGAGFPSKAEDSQ